MPGPDATTPIQVDRVLGGRYRLIRPIAKGGMAEVWEGRDEILSRPVAVKVLQAHLAADDTFIERFRREAISAARLTHPGVVATFDTGTDAGTAWIVMELVRGDTLRHLLNTRGPMDPPMAIDVAAQIADALAHAHRAGLVHRDVKPANILLVEEDGTPRAKVTDFGIAKATERLGLDLTRTGIVLGTPKYLSPEQVEGHEPDARADLYSLGVVLFEMLTGRPPFEGPTDMATAIAHVRQDAPRVSSLRPGIPAGLDDLVADLLAKDPAARIPSAAALRTALLALPTRGSPPRPRAFTPEDPTRVGPAAPASPPSALRGPVGPAPTSFASDRGAAPSEVARRSRDGQPPRSADPAQVATGVNALGGRVGHPPVSDGRPAPGSGRSNRTPPLPSPALPSSARPGPARPAPGVPRPPRPSEPVAPRTATNAGPGSWAPTDPGAASRPWAADPTGVVGSEAGATRVNHGVGPPTGVLHGGPPASGPVPTVPGAAGPRRRRRRWGPFLVVAALVVAGAVVAGILLGSGGRPTIGTAGGGGSASTAAPVTVSSVGVWMMNARPPDNPDQTGLTFDGKTSTAWSTDHYATATFGGYYSGMGLAIHLDGTHTLHQLTVDSSTQGWAAQTYVSTTEPASGQAVSAWGQPTDARTGIDGSVTFTLGGTSGQWVLLWLTNLGPADQANVEELTVR